MIKYKFIMLLYRNMSHKIIFHKTYFCRKRLYKFNEFIINKCIRTEIFIWVLYNTYFPPPNWVFSPLHYCYKTLYFRRLFKNADNAVMTIKN